MSANGSGQIDEDVELLQLTGACDRQQARDGAFTVLAAIAKADLPSLNGVAQGARSATECRVPDSRRWLSATARRNPVARIAWPSGTRRGRAREESPDRGSTTWKRCHPVPRGSRWKRSSRASPLIVPQTSDASPPSSCLRRTRDRRPFFVVSTKVVRHRGRRRGASARAPRPGRR